MVFQIRLNRSPKKQFNISLENSEQIFIRNYEAFIYLITNFVRNETITCNEWQPSLINRYVKNLILARYFFLLNTGS